MPFLDYGPRLKEVTLQAINEMRERTMLAINNLDRTNFHRRIRGDDILLPRSVSPSRMLWDEYIIPLVMAAPHFTTTSTAPIDIGGFFPWHPTRFGGGIWQFEADMAIANTAAVATCQLFDGVTVLVAVTTNATALTRLRSTGVPMPTEARNLWARVLTNNAAHAAILGGAKLIFIPN